MGSLWLPKLADWLRAAGLTVVEYQGWQERSRSSGGFDDILAIGWHHDAAGQRTGQAAADAHWRYHVDRPVGNLALDRNGVWWVGAAGASNTQGKGGPMQMSRGLMPLDRANQHTIAVEAANNGVGEVWPQHQLDAYVRGTAAIIHGLANDGAWDTASRSWRPIALDPRRDVVAHFEWAPGRKIDPAGPPWALPGDQYLRWDMNAARARVAELLAPQPPEDWTMKPYSNRVLDTRNGGPVQPGAPRVVEVGMATQALVRIQAVDPLGAGYLSFDGGATSCVNYQPGVAVASDLAYVATPGGRFELSAHVTGVHVVVDVQGLG